MKQKHIYAEVIKAWADGAEVQFRRKNDANFVWTDIARPTWQIECYEYRVKPEPRPDVVIEECLFLNGNCTITRNGTGRNKVRYIFDAENGYKLKSVEIVK